MAYYKCGQIYVTENTNTSVGTASGAVSTFNTLVSKPLVSLKASFKATQASGIPTPSNPISIDGVSNVKVTRCGKNLVDINYLTASGITISGNEASGTAQAFSDNFGLNTNGLTQLKFKTNTAYTLSFKAYTDGSYSTSGTGLYFKILYTDGSYTSLAVNNNQQEFGYFNKTTSASRTIDKIQIAYSGGYSNTWYIKEIQLEEDSTASDYEQYNGDSVTIALGGTYYGSYIAKDASGSKLVNNFSELVLLNSLTWYPTVKQGNTCFYANLPNGIIKSGGEQLFNGFCESYKVTNDFNMSSDLTCVFYCSSLYGGYTRVLIRDDNASAMTGDEFKEYVTDKISYPINTPIELPLTDIPDITTLTGVNNVFNDSGDTECQYTSLPYTIETASGAVANFSTSLALPLISAKYGVDAIQDLHGQDYPFPAGGGKNLFPPKAVSTSDLSITLRDDGGIQINGTSTSAFNATVVSSLKAGSYTLSCRFMGTTPSEGAARCQIYHQGTGLNVAIPNQDNTNSNKQFTVSEDLTSVEYRIRISANFNYQNLVYYPQLEKSSTMTNFVPYVIENICPISGRNEVKVGYADFNQLINVNAVTTVRNGITYTNNNDGSWTLTGTPDSSNVFLNLDYVIGRTYLKSNHIYFLPKCNNSSLKIGLGLFGGTVDTYSIDGDRIVKFSFVSSEKNWTRIQISNAGNTNIGTVVIKPQLYDITQMFGSNIADYLYSLPDNGLSIIKQLLTKDYYPYNAGDTWVTIDSINGEHTCPNATFNLNDTIYGGYVTQDKNGVKLVVTHSGLVSLGSFSWNTATSEGYSQSPSDISGMLKTASGSTIPDMFCNALKIDTPTNVYNKVSDNSISIASANSRLRVYMSSIAGYTNAQIQSALSDIYIAYPLATPIEINLTNTDLFTTISGTNNVFTDSGDSEVVYKKSV